MDLDSFDKHILRILQQDARISMVALAEQVGLSPTPCTRRVQRLEQEGVIRGYMGVIDQEAVGLPVSVFIFIKLDRQSREGLDSFETRIGELPEVVDCYLMSGRFDYLLRVVARDIRAFEHFLKEQLTRIEGISSIESSFAMKQVQHRSVLPIP